MPSPTLHAPTLHVPSPWRALETQVGLNTIPAIWREKMGAQFDTFRSAFFQPHSKPAHYFPRRKCGCAHDVSSAEEEREPNNGREIIALCTCAPWHSPTLVLPAADIEVL